MMTTNQQMNNLETKYNVYSSNPNNHSYEQYNGRVNSDSDTYDSLILSDSDEGESYYNSVSGYTRMDFSSKYTRPERKTKQVTSRDLFFRKFSSNAIEELRHDCKHDDRVHTHDISRTLRGWWSDLKLSDEQSDVELIASLIKEARETNIKRKKEMEERAIKRKKEMEEYVNSREQSREDRILKTKGFRAFRKDQMSHEQVVSYASLWNEWCEHCEEKSLTYKYYTNFDFYNEMDVDIDDYTRGMGFDNNEDDSEVEVDVEDIVNRIQMLKDHQEETSEKESNWHMSQGYDHYMEYLSDKKTFVPRRL